MRLAGESGAEEVPVNSLHNQGIQRLAPRLEAMGWAPDGTVEAVRVRAAAGFAWGVQWHPEYDWERDGFSRRIFEAFGAACSAWSGRRYQRLAAE
jgi:putative glutamine amidotransferase